MILGDEVLRDSAVLALANPVMCRRIGSLCISDACPLNNNGGRDYHLFMSLQLKYGIR
jgi:hypothetical protein